MCVDYRKLNEKTVKDAYLLTRIDENLDTLSLSGTTRLTPVPSASDGVCSGSENCPNVCPPLLENECPFRSGLMQNVSERSGTFPKPCGLWHSCRRESKEMSHGRRAVRYQCPSRDDESNDYGESDGQCGPYQEPQGFGKVPEQDTLVYVA
jgi:hypothetical protein